MFLTLIFLFLYAHEIMFTPTDVEGKSESSTGEEEVAFVGFISRQEQQYNRFFTNVFSHKGFRSYTVIILVMRLYFKDLNAFSLFGNGNKSVKSENGRFVVRFLREPATLPHTVSMKGLENFNISSHEFTKTGHEHENKAMNPIQYNQIIKT